MSTTRFVGPIDQPAPLTVTCTSNDAVTEIVVRGELDVAEAEAFPHEVLRCCGQDRRHVRLRFDAVTFVDLAGLRALGDTWTRLTANGAEVEIASWSSALVRMVGLARTAGWRAPAGFPTPVSLSVQPAERVITAKVAETDVAALGES